MKGRAPKAKGEDEREVSKVPRPHNGDFPWGFRDFQWGFSNKNADFPDVSFGIFQHCADQLGDPIKGCIMDANEMIPKFDRGY